VETSGLIGLSQIPLEDLISLIVAKNMMTAMVKLERNAIRVKNSVTMNSLNVWSVNVGFDIYQAGHVKKKPIDIGTLLINMATEHLKTPENKNIILI